MNITLSTTLTAAFDRRTTSPKATRDRPALEIGRSSIGNLRRRQAIAHVHQRVHTGPELAPFLVKRCPGRCQYGTSRGRRLALPWRPRSVRRAFDKVLAETGDRAFALSRLTALQGRLFVRDAVAVWGPDHPAVQGKQISKEMLFSFTLGEMTQLLDRTIKDKPRSMGRLQDMIWRRAVSVLCTVALILVAFAHRPVESDPRLSDPQISTYLALGGSLADICISGEEGQEHAAPTDCTACTIAKSMALAPACLALMGLVVWSSHRAAWPETLVLTGHGPRAPPARGPPSIVLI